MNGNLDNSCSLMNQYVISILVIGNMGGFPIGIAAHCAELLKYTEKWSILPVYTVDGYVAQDIIKGSYDDEEFNEFVKNFNQVSHTS